MILYELYRSSEMKLIIQIPCFNEEKNLPVTLKDIPKKIEGIDKIEILIIDDGSTDRTRQVAKECGVDHVIGFTKRNGLARAFITGLDTSLKLGADIIVNTDADNQYKGEDIPRLVKPIVDGEADLVVGNRNIDNIKHFSWIKKRLQKIGSWVVRYVSKTKVPDTTSGFRAYSKEAALKMNIVSDFTYTLETLIQAGTKKIAIKNIMIDTNEDLRKSRLYKSILEYVLKSVVTIFRIHTMYYSLKTFFVLGGSIFSVGFLIGCRFLYFFIVNQGIAGHVQSLILAVALIIMGFQIMVLGLLADIISANRRLIEDNLSRLKKLEVSKIDNSP